jgi:TonB family protein
MRVLVGEDGNVKSVRVVRSLPDGLTEEAISAARQTTFKPAMKDGKPVPFWVGLEMNFNIS